MKSTDRIEALLPRALRQDVLKQHAYMVGDARGLIKLDAMENPFGLPDQLMAELATQLAAVALNRYPDARATRLRDTLRHRYGLSDQQDVLLGNGSDELISMIVTACATPDASVLTLGPGFVMYRMSAEFARVRFSEVPLTAEFQIDLDATLAVVRAEQPSVIFIAYPNNPTGSLYSRAAIDAIIEASDGLVVIDEAYEAFSPDSYLPDLSRSPRLLLLRTLSKVGLAGIRLGYLIGARELIAEFDKVRPPYNINVLTQCAAQFALEHHQVLEQQAKILVAERALLAQELARRAGVTVFDSKANFILFRIESAAPDAAARVFTGIRQNGVLIKNVSAAHALLHNCLRVTVSTPEENRAFLDAFDRAWPLPVGRAA